MQAEKLLNNNNIPTIQPRIKGKSKRRPKIQFAELSKLAPELTAMKEGW